MAENGSNVAEGEILLSRSSLSMWFDENFDLGGMLYDFVEDAREEK